MAEPALAVHGGAGGRLPSDEGPYHKALAAALDAGWAALASGGALPAVEAAVAVLEDAPLFNAGRGSVLTAAGSVEMDAGIAYGPSLRTGAVACVTRVRNPVRLARAVMERTPHVLLAGRGAEALAVELDLELMKPSWFVTPRERERLAAGTVGAASEAAAMTSIDRRIVVSTGNVVARNPAMRGPRSTPSVVASSWRTPWTRLCEPCEASRRLSMSSASASNLIKRRSRSSVTVLMARGVASIVRRAPGATRS